MNATTILMNQAVSKQKNVSGQLNNHNKDGETSPFAKVLHGEVRKQEVSKQTSAEEPKKVEPSSLSEVDKSIQVVDFKEPESQELKSAMEQLLDLIPINEGYMDPKLLQNPEVLALLAQLPQQFQQLLTNFIQSGESFEHLLTQTENGSKEQLGLMLLAIYQLENRGQQLPNEINEADFVMKLQRQLNEVFNVQMPEESSSAKILLTKLVQKLDEKNTDERSQNTPLNKLELRKIIQRVLYANSNNPNSGNENSTEKESFGTTVSLREPTALNDINEDVFDQVVASSIKEGGSVKGIQQYVLHVNQPTGSIIPEDQILEQLNNIMKQSKFSSSPNGTSQLFIKLNPAHLGSLIIKLTETNGEMIARIIASSATAKEVIESNLNNLKHVLTTQNINVEKFEIGYQGDSQYGEANRESSGQDGQSKRRQEHQELNQLSNEDEASEGNSFKDELLNMIV